MQKGTPQPTTSTTTASAQLLSPDVDLAHNFLHGCEDDIKNLLCDVKKHTARGDFPLNDATALATAISAGLGPLVVSWLAVQTGTTKAVVIAAAVSVTLIATAIIMKIGVAAFCRFGTGALNDQGAQNPSNSDK